MHNPAAGAGVMSGGGAGEPRVHDALLVACMTPQEVSNELSQLAVQSLQATALAPAAQKQVLRLIERGPATSPAVQRAKIVVAKAMRRYRQSLPPAQQVRWKALVEHRKRSRQQARASVGTASLLHQQSGAARDDRQSASVTAAANSPDSLIVPASASGFLGFQTFKQ